MVPIRQLSLFLIVRKSEKDKTRYFYLFPQTLLFADAQQPLNGELAGNLKPKVGIYPVYPP